MAKAIDSQVSILGSSYFQPIACLIEQWIKYPKNRTNAVQSGYYEYGFSSSVILLLVAMFESYIVRVRYINRSNIPVNLRTAFVSGCLNPHVNGEHITVDMASMTEGAPTPSFLFA